MTHALGPGREPICARRKTCSRRVTLPLSPLFLAPEPRPARTPDATEGFALGSCGPRGEVGGVLLALLLPAVDAVPPCFPPPPPTVALTAAAAAAAPSASAATTSGEEESKSGRATPTRLKISLSNRPFTFRSSGEGDMTDGETFTSIIHGFKSASSRTSKPNSS